MTIQNKVAPETARALRARLQQVWAFAGLIVICLVFFIATPDFLTFDNITIAWPHVQAGKIRALTAGQTPVVFTSRHSCQRFKGVDSIGPSQSTPALATCKRPARAIAPSSAGGMTAACKARAAATSSAATSWRCASSTPSDRPT